MEPEENFLSTLHQYGLIPKIRIAINGKSPVRYYNENGILFTLYAWKYRLWKIY